MDDPREIYERMRQRALQEIEECEAEIVARREFLRLLDEDEEFGIEGE